MKPNVFIASVLTAFAWTLTTALSGQPASSPTLSLLSDTEIRRILVDRIDVQRQGVGMVVGIVTPAGRRVVSYGTFSTSDARPVTSDSVFEIGSVTKVFTSWLLADMVRRNEVGLADPAARYLPTGMTINSATNGRTMTLVDLATHTAGLPFWPSNVPATGNNNAALAGYTVAQLFEFISTFEVPPDIGTRWAYSNIDAGLLGILLGRHVGSTFDALLAARITNPLKLSSTAITVTSEMTSRLVTGHDAQLNKAPRWNVPAMAGGGSLHSSADDLLTFMAALGDTGSPISAALPTMLETRRQGPGFQQALGWMVISRSPDDQILFHDGQTLGFASSIAYDPRARTGVVVLANAAAGVGDIARHVLRPAIPLASPTGPAPKKTEIQVDGKLFNLYAGQYEPGAGTIFTVAREGDSLMLQLPGLPKLRLRPESETDFFVAENTRISVTFEVDSGGQVTRMVLRAPTGNVPAARVERR
jgi:serine-type D-Ala-D-Ala carboxypeptidase/endopeptidase